jgi:tetratricopeptide (TPR) repeat protein
MHAGSACLVAIIARRLLLSGAWLAGFVFALHPVCVEAVAWISEQKSTFSGLLCLAAALAYMHFDRTRKTPHYFLATALFVLAVLSKTVTAMLPAALLVVFWWQRGRLQWRCDVLPLIPWLTVGAAAGTLTAWIERTFIGAEGADFLLTPIQRILLAGRLICFYTGKVLWPTNLMFTYPRWQIDPTDWRNYLFPAGVVAVAAGLSLIARRSRGPLSGFLVFVGTLFPVLGFLNVYPFRFSWAADHFQYLACLGIIIPLTTELTLATRWLVKGRACSTGLYVSLLVTLGIITCRYSGTYRDAETLYRETLAQNPDSWMAHNNLGYLLFRRPGRLPDAVAEYRSAVRIKPDYADSHYNLGVALMNIRGQLPEAITAYETAVRIRPNYPEAHNNLGNALSLVSGRLPEAVAEYQTALRLNPDYANAHYNLGNALSRIPGRLSEAIAEFQTALRLDPENAEAHNNLASALLRTPGRLPDAIAEFQKALRIRPGYPEAYNNLGTAFMEVPGGLPNAVAAFQSALHSKPDYEDAYYNLGRALSRIPGRLPEAIAAYQAALKINPADADAHSELGDALSQMPDGLANAIIEYETALRINPNTKAAQIRLRKFRAGGS